MIFRGEGAARPQKKSLIGAVVATVVVLLGSQVSPVVGYLFALAAMVMIVVALFTDSIWPTRIKKEKPLVFALFWGLMLGVLVPFVVETFLEGGWSAVVEMLTSPP